MDDDNQNVENFSQEKNDMETIYVYVDTLLIGIKVKYKVGVGTKDWDFDKVANDRFLIK